MQDDRQDGEFERELELWASSESEARVSPETQRSIGRLLSASLAPVKPLPSEHSLALTIFLVFAACAGALIGVTGQPGFQLMTGTQMVSMAAILGAAGAFSSLALAGRMIPGSLRSFPMPVALALWCWRGCSVISVARLDFLRFPRLALRRDGTDRCHSFDCSFLVAWSARRAAP
jgi:hypothetical protein